MLSSLKRTDEMQKRPLCEQWCFPDRVRTEHISLQHGLGAESPSCLVSLSFLRLAKAVWIHETSYILPRRQKETQHKRKEFQKITFLTLIEKFLQFFSALCNGMKWDSSIKSQTIVWMATIIAITWAFYSSYCSWKPLIYKAWRAAWSESKSIVEWCMHEYVSCLYYGIQLQQTYCLLSDIHGQSPQGDEQQRCFLEC